MREIRKSTVMDLMVLSLRSPEVDGREELITRSGTPTWLEATLWLTFVLNSSPTTS